MKIGNRLTLWGTTFTLATCAVVCMALYAGLHFSLHEEVDRFLEGEVQEFYAILQEEGDVSLQVIEEDIRRELGSRLRNDLSFRLLDAQGRLVVTSHWEDALPNPWNLDNSRPEAGAGVWFDNVVPAKGARRVRTCSQRTRLPGRGEFIIQATYSLNGVAAALAQFRNLSLGALAIAFVISLVGGRILARKNLTPVNQMTKSAERITAENLSNRVARSNNGDELDRLAAVLNDMLERLDRQFRRMQQFTADAAHELRTPLTVLRGIAEIALGEKAAPEDRQRALEESIEEYDRLSRLTDDLILLARADAGLAVDRFVPMALDIAARDVVDLFAPLAQERKIELTCSNGAKIEIQAEPMRIRQVLSNLLDNALKHTPAGGKVAVAVSVDDKFARLSVSDTGPGIPNEHLPRLFDRFYRADESRARQTGGFGLGLAICKAIVEAHSGKIHIESDGKTGTKVCAEFLRIDQASDGRM